MRATASCPWWSIKSRACNGSGIDSARLPAEPRTRGRGAPRVSENKYLCCQKLYIVARAKIPAFPSRNCLAYVTTVLVAIASRTHASVTYSAATLLAVSRIHVPDPAAQSYPVPFSDKVYRREYEPRVSMAGRETLFPAPSEGDHAIGIRSRRGFASCAHVRSRRNVNYYVAD